MKKYKTVVYFLCLISLLACTNEKQQNKEVKKVEVQKIDNNKEIAKKPTLFFIKDSSKYSKEFLEKLKNTHPYKTVSLIEDSIIINNDRKSAILFPKDLPLKKSISYTKIDSGKSYSLQIKRINYSSIEYKYEEKSDDKILHKLVGIAHLRGNFYLSAAGFFEDESNITYGTYEYISDSEECQLNIHVGNGSVIKSFVTRSCDSEKDKISSPELIIQKQ